MNLFFEICLDGLSEKYLKNFSPKHALSLPPPASFFFSSFFLTLFKFLNAK
jgi:hypothetical protein